MADGVESGEGVSRESDGRDPLLAARGLTKHYPITSGLLRREVGRVRAVDGIDLELRHDETLGLVGESGCGKSTVARTLLGLEPPTAGEVWFDGRRLDEFDRAEEKAFRRRAAMVFQDPTSSFDPRMTVGEAVEEPLRIHGLADPERRRDVAVDLLERVGLTEADADSYPHALSGGQKQRAALARALVLNPDLLVADEPVSALDASVQAEILSLFEYLRDRFDLSVLLISHDVDVVRQVCDRVAVMYVGELVEVGPTQDVLESPEHPYTEALMASVPKPDPTARAADVELSGSVPDPSDPPTGCRFHPRCPKVVPPPGFDLEQRAWRALLDLRVALRRGEVALAPLDGEPGADDGSDPDGRSRSGDAIRTALREEYGLPTRLSDDGAERVLDEAVDDLAAGDRQAATGRLRDAFTTTCETDRPRNVQIRDAHRVACHLHDERVGGGDD